MIRRAIAVSILALTLSATEASAFTLTLDPGSNTSVATSDACMGVCDTDVDNTLMIPELGSTSAAQGGSDTLLNWDLTTTSFDITLSQTAGPQEQESAVSDVTLYFSVDEDVSYSFAGSYFHDNAGDNSMLMNVQLREASGGASLFRHVNGSYGGGDVTVDLGTSNGGTLDLVGSLTGTLSAGTEYRLFASYRLEDIIFDFSGSEANGSGNLSLGFSPIPAPEPSTGLLLGMGLVVLAARRPRSSP